MKVITFLASVLILVMMAATAIEASWGTTFVHESIYGTWWFAVLWVLLALCGGACTIKRKLYRNTPVFLLHASFIIILLGALATHLTQREGAVHLRQGMPVRPFIEHDGRPEILPFSLRLDTFFIAHQEESDIPHDYVSRFTILPDNVQHEVSMNNILTYNNIRFYQSDYDDDLCGSVLLINSDPTGLPVTYMGYALMGIALLSLFMQKRHRSQFLLSLPLLGAVCVFFINKDYALPVLDTWLLPVHVSTIMTAYILLFIALFRRSMLPVAVGFLALGIFIGAYWASISWGNYWSWDSKEVWALITLLIASAPLHTRSISMLRSDRAYRLYMILALLSVLMTYLGVNALLPGLHSYA